MISNSKAYLVLRDRSQEFLDFVVLACTAVPTINGALTSGVHLSLVQDYFKGTITPAQLLQRSANYQDPLSRMIVFSMFSYFEAYVKTLLSEIVDFHGGPISFQATADKRAKLFLKTPSKAIVDSKRKLQEPAKKKNRALYEKHSALLVKSGFRFPSELLAPYGVRNLIQKAKPKGSKAYELQVLIGEALCFPLSPNEATRLDGIRTIRNDIAHGKPGVISLSDAINITKDLRALSVKIDAHAVEHFFVLETYA